MKSTFLLLTVAALVELTIGAALWSRHAPLITDLIEATSLILWAVALVTGATVLVGVLASVRFASSFLAGLGVITTILLASLVGAVGGLAVPYAALWFAASLWPDVSGSKSYVTLLALLPGFGGVAGAAGLPPLILGRAQQASRPRTPFD